MVERRMELTRRYHRKKKVRKLKLKIARTTDERAKAKLVEKIRFLSPEWQPAQ